MNNPVNHYPVSSKQVSRQRSAVIALFIATFCALTALLLPVVSQSQVTRSAPKPVPPNEAYLQPVPGLSHGELRKFRAGEKQFKAPWVVFPLLGGEWGLGPTFLANSCVGCHNSDAVLARHSGLRRVWIAVVAAGKR